METDDFVLLVAGNKQETETATEQIRNRLSAIELELSAEKTTLTHWSKKVNFLGYQIQGGEKVRGVGIRAVLSIPHEKQQQ